MALSSRFLKASTSIAALALAAGCVTTNPMPEYRSVDAGTRTAGTPTDTQGIRYYPNGEPVGVNYNACRELQTATRSANNDRIIDRSVDRGVNDVGRAARTERGRSNIGDVLIGTGIGIGAAIFGQKAREVVKDPKITILEADCNQQRARADWEKTQRVNARSTGRAGVVNNNINEKRVDECVKSETRRGVPYTQALPTCRAAVLGQ